MIVSDLTKHVTSTMRAQSYRAAPIELLDPRHVSYNLLSLDGGLPSHLPGQDTQPLSMMRLREQIDRAETVDLVPLLPLCITLPN